MALARTQYVRSGDADIAYQVLGDGPHRIVVVLDWASHLEALVEQPFIAEWFTSLARFSRVLWLGTRGVGMSGPLNEGSPLASWMHDLVTVMDAAGFERASLVSHGLGAQMALIAAATYPERVDSLVVVNGYARFAQADDYPAGLPEHLHEPYLDALERQWGAPVSMLMDSARRSFTDRASWSGGRESSASVRHRASHGHSSREFSRSTCATRSHSWRSPRLSSTAATTCSPAWVMGATWPTTSRARVTSSATARITGRCRIRISSARSRSSSPGRRAGAGDWDRVLATILFVDVVGSTEFAAELGDRTWRVALERFEHVVRTALAAFDGKLEDTAGDGVLATFDGPTHAIRCARRIRDEARLSGLEVRCGLHAGEVTRRSGGIAGIAVHIGARVSALAEPGEVLVTRTVRDAVVGSGIVFEERGEHELKGVPDRWALYAAAG